MHFCTFIKNYSFAVRQSLIPLKLLIFIRRRRRCDAESFHLLVEQRPGYVEEIRGMSLVIAEMLQHVFDQLLFRFAFGLFDDVAV